VCWQAQEEVAHERRVTAEMELKLREASVIEQKLKQHVCGPAHLSVCGSRGGDGSLRRGR
jgi:hypothetical protein